VIGQLNDELRISQPNLQSLAEDSGGAAAINRNDYSGRAVAYCEGGLC
jgi:hypothetical protein